MKNFFLIFFITLSVISCEINEEISSCIQFNTNSGMLINIGNKKLLNKSKLIFQLLEKTHV